MKRYLPALSAFLAAVCLISAPFVGALAEDAAPKNALPSAKQAAQPAAAAEIRQPDGSVRTFAAAPADAAPTASADAAPASAAADSAAASAAAPGPAISARSAIVTDPEAGAVLYEKDADRTALIASTTKIMTGWLACRFLDLDAVYPVPPAAVGVEGSSMYLGKYEEVSGRDLVLGLMLHSGNDAAEAIALLLDGEEASFVERMNREAAALGLADTHFANPHGLDSRDNYSTARDLARLTAAALTDPTFAEIVATRQTVAAGRTLKNHNRLLWTYPGCVGVKTGYTQAAGRILVSAARRGGRLLICVTLDAPGDWADHRQLLDAAFAQYHEIPAARAGEELLRVRLGSGGQGAGSAPADGENDRGGLPLIAEEDLSILLLPGEELSYHFSPLTPAGTAPSQNAADRAPQSSGNAPPQNAADEALRPAEILAPGAEAGTVEIRVDGRPAGTVRVRWGGDG